MNEDCGGCGFRRPHGPSAGQSRSQSQTQTVASKDFTLTDSWKPGRSSPLCPLPTPQLISNHSANPPDHIFKELCKPFLSPSLPLPQPLCLHPGWPGLLASSVAVNSPVGGAGEVLTMLKRLIMHFMRSQKTLKGNTKK